MRLRFWKKRRPQKRYYVDMYEVLEELAPLGQEVIRDPDGRIGVIKFPPIIRAQNQDTRGQ